MGRVLHPLLLLVGKMVHAQLVRENECLRPESRILRSRVDDKVIRGRAHIWAVIWKSQGVARWAAQALLAGGVVSAGEGQSQ